jgi:hypothetical protein
VLGLVCPGAASTEPKTEQGYHGTAETDCRTVKLIESVADPLLRQFNKNE